MPQRGRRNENGSPRDGAFDEPRDQQPAAGPRDLPGRILRRIRQVAGALPIGLPLRPIARRRSLVHGSSSPSNVRSDRRARVSRAPTFVSLVSCSSAISRWESPSRRSMTA